MYHSNGLFYIYSSNLKHFPCMIEKDGNKVAYLFEETGRRFLESADFLEYCENTIASSTVNENEEAIHSYRYDNNNIDNCVAYCIVL